MRDFIFSILVVTACLTTFSCNEESEESKAKMAASEFLSAFYQLDFKEAARLSTPESKNALTFISSNVSEADKKLVANEQDLEIEITHCTIENNTAQITYKVKNNLHLQFITQKSTIAPPTTQTMVLKKSAANWLVAYAIW